MNLKGASKLQRIIKALQAKRALKCIDLVEESSSFFCIKKRNDRSEQRTEFQFRFRVEIQGAKEVWWPVSYSNIHGESVSCEMQFNGKTLTNIAKQDYLVELAESWARSLEAEHVVNTVGNALR